MHKGRLKLSTQSLQASMAKLSSGKRINKAADDAAGLAVSENLKADIRSLKMAARNANDGTSLVQTAEGKGSLVETSNMLIRLRELAVQAASDTIGNREREFLDKEYLQLKDEIDRIANATEFNGTRLLVGNAELPSDLNQPTNEFPFAIQVGKGYYRGADTADSRNPVNMIKIDFNHINSFTHGDGFRNLSKSRGHIRDTDFAAETAAMTQANIMQQAGRSVLANANRQPQIALSLLNS